MDIEKVLIGVTLVETECLRPPAWEFTALLTEHQDMADVVPMSSWIRLHRKEHPVG